MMMSLATALGRRPLQAVVVGQGALASRVTAALGGLAGLGLVRQMSALPPRLAGVDVVVSLVPGVQPALDVLLGALSQGVATVTNNATVLAVHGELLHNAAQGQCTRLGVQAAVAGVPLAALGQALQPEQVLLLTASAGQAVLQRQEERAESGLQAVRELERLGADTSDVQGKVTLARATVLRQLLGWPMVPATQAQRQGVFGLEKHDVSGWRALGLRVAFGAEVTPHSTVVGPLLLAQEAADVPAWGEESVQLLSRQAGATTLRWHGQDEVQQVVASVLADVQLVLDKTRWQARRWQLAPALPNQARPLWVRLPYAQRAAQLEHLQVLDERVPGDGTWQALVYGDGGALAPRLEALGGLVLPLVSTAAAHWQQRALDPTPRRLPRLRVVGE